MYSKYNNIAIQNYCLVSAFLQVYVWTNQRLEYLTRYTANQVEYMIIKDREGQVKHVPGYVIDCNVWCDRKSN